jgi:Domain of unknown function (DUF4845)
MESNRQGHRMNAHLRRRQTGITAIGFLLLATLFGVVGLAGIKLTPMYIKNMKLSTALQDIERELGGTGSTPAAIRSELLKRFSIEDIDLPADNIKVAQSKNGYTVQIQYENRAPYAAGVWLVLVFDKQVEIRR